MLEAIILGLIQGLTEFLPVSSSGHLVVVPYLVSSWEQPSLAFDVALHFGTLVAVVAYFAGDLWWMTTRALGIGGTGSAERSRARRTVGLLAVGTVPAAVAGYALEDLFAGVFTRPDLVAGFLVATGLLLIVAEWVRRRRAAVALDTPVGQLTGADRVHDPGRSEATTGWVDAGVVGLAQALAIFPGMSRSGATIAAGMLRGLSREAAARFSFLLAVPVILGATVFKLGDLTGGGAAAGPHTGIQTVVAAAVAAVSGWWAIRFLLRLVTGEDLLGFARYVILFGLLTFVGTLWLGPVSSV